MLFVNQAIRTTKLARLLEASVLLAYFSMVAVGVVAHEPWFDEAQAWLLARDAGPGELLTHFLRYEGHPPLWYWLLSIPAKIGLPYKTINLISAAVAFWGVILLIRSRRVPLALRAAIPFSFFIAYQYTIVSRSYVLVFPLLIIILGLDERREERLFAFTATLVLLSLVSLHGLSLAGAFVALYAVELARERIRNRKSERSKRLDIPAHVAAAGVLLATVGFIGYVLRPAHDLAIKAIVDLRFSPAKMLAVGGTALLDSVSGVNLPAAAAVVTLIVWFAMRGTLLTFSLLTASLLPISSVYFNLWHEGLFFFVLLFTILLTFARMHERTRFDAAILFLTVALLVIQIFWTCKSLGYDIDHEYSGSREAAMFVKNNHLDQRKLFGMGFPCLALEPYFGHNIYANYGTPTHFSFWDWSTRAPWFYSPSIVLRPVLMHAWFESQIAQRPDFVMVSVKFPPDVSYVRWFLSHPEYRLVQQFEGRLFWKTRVTQQETFLLYSRTGPPALAHRHSLSFSRTSRTSDVAQRADAHPQRDRAQELIWIRSSRQTRAAPEQP